MGMSDAVGVSFSCLKVTFDVIDHLFVVCDLHDKPSLVLCVEASSGCLGMLYMLWCGPHDKSLAIFCCGVRGRV